MGEAKTLDTWKPEAEGKAAEAAAAAPSTLVDLLGALGVCLGFSILATGSCRNAAGLVSTRPLEVVTTWDLAFVLIVLFVLVLVSIVRRLFPVLLIASSSLLLLSRPGTFQVRSALEIAVLSSTAVPAQPIVAVGLLYIWHRVSFGSKTSFGGLFADFLLYHLDENLFHSIKKKLWEALARREIVKLFEIIL